MVARERVEGRDGLLGFTPIADAPRSHGDRDVMNAGISVYTCVELLDLTVRPRMAGLCARMHVKLEGNLRLYDQAARIISIS